MSNYIYLLQEREFITTKQNIYKLGKTKQENLRRFKQYPKGSKLIIQQVCDDCDMLETQLIRYFKNKYIHRKDIGNEYFEGDNNEMVKDIHNKITNNVVSNEDIDCKDETKVQIEINDEVIQYIPPKFICPKCNKIYKDKRYIEKHQEKCKGVDSLTCPRCMVSFTTRQHKSKHVKANKCKARSIIHARTPNIQNIYNDSSIQNIETQQNNQNIIINNYGSERMDHITYDDVKNMLMQGDNTIPKYIEKKHFDKNFPENNNIVYDKENQCQIYENNSWKKRKLSMLSSKLVKQNSGELLTFCNHNGTQLSNDIQNDDTFEYIKSKLLCIYHKYDNKYTDIYNMVRDIIINSQ